MPILNEGPNPYTDLDKSLTDLRLVYQPLLSRDERWAALNTNNRLADRAGANTLLSDQEKDHEEHKKKVLENAVKLCTDMLVAGKITVEALWYRFGDFRQNNKDYIPIELIQKRITEALVTRLKAQTQVSTTTDEITNRAAGIGSQMEQIGIGESGEKSAVQ